MAAASIYVHGIIQKKTSYNLLIKIYSYYCNRFNEGHSETH